MADLLVTLNPDSTPDSSITDDIIELKITQSIGTLKYFEILIDNDFGEWNGRVQSGTTVLIHLEGTDVLKGIIADVEKREHELLAKGYDLSWKMIGYKVSRTYEAMDYGKLVKSIVQSATDDFNFDYFIDSLYQISEPQKFKYQEAMQIINTSLLSIGYILLIDDVNSQVKIVKNGTKDLFIDCFRTYTDGSDGSTNWTIESGTWVVDSTNETYTGSDAGWSVVSRGDVNWTHYEVRGLIKLDTSTEAGFLMRYSGTDGYLITIDSNNLYIKKYSDKSTLGTLSLSETLNTNDFYLLEVEIENYDFTLKVTKKDGTEILNTTFTDTLNLFSYGKVGLVVNGGSASFKQIAVWGYGFDTLEVEEDALMWNISNVTSELANRVVVYGGYETFTDDFEDETLSQWEGFSGTGSYSIASSEITLSSSGDYILWSRTYLANIDARLDFNISSSSTDKVFNFFFRTSADYSQYYKVKIDSTNSLISLETDVGTIESVSQTIDLDTSNTLRVKAVSNNIKLYYNGVLLMDVADSTYSAGKIGIGVTNSEVKIGSINIETDRQVVASYSYDDLIGRFGVKELPPVYDSSLVTKEMATNRAILELARIRYEKTKCEVILDGSPSYVLSDVIILNAPTSGVTNTPYRVVTIEHIVSEREGYVTRLVLSEETRDLGIVIKDIWDRLFSILSSMTVTEEQYLSISESLSVSDEFVTTLKSVFVYDTDRWELSSWG